MCVRVLTVLLLWRHCDPRRGCLTCTLLCAWCADTVPPLLSHKRPVQPPAPSLDSAVGSGGGAKAVWPPADAEFDGVGAAAPATGPSSTVESQPTAATTFQTDEGLEDPNRNPFVS